ncbi:MAG: phosphatidylserine decarboxylase family protein [Mariprofundus sp.]|nr:phosphatidylserine decarboxylase family protein [Mariprofundus sp.]
MSTNLPLSGHPRASLPFSPQGWPFIISTAIAMIVAWSLCWTITAGVLLLLLLFMLNFFRDPEREIPEGEGLFVSPADGKVIRAELMDSGHYRVDIFMNIFNVHVNRAPVAGRITNMKYFPGKFVNASFDKASEENERNRFEMECEDGSHIAFTQISGLIARRIVSYVKLGDDVAAGQRIGMIRFGSRVNCEFPADCELQVKKGDVVSAGTTILARYTDIIDTNGLSNG